MSMKKITRHPGLMRVIIIYGLEILMAIFGVSALCIFLMNPRAITLIAGIAGCALSVLIDYRNDGWVEKRRYKYSDYKHD